MRVITPGVDGGRVAARALVPRAASSRWDHDPESARAALSAADLARASRCSGAIPIRRKSREHVLLSVLAERRLRRARRADLAPCSTISNRRRSTRRRAAVDAFLPEDATARALAAALNTLLASPTFASWRQGATLDVGAWLTPRGRSHAGRDRERRAPRRRRARARARRAARRGARRGCARLPGTQRLRALVVFDEVYGFLPPHPANPPTKRPLVALMKQARAFGVGVVVATQNPMDLDYRALGNAGLWCVGRLQTDADRARVLDGLAASRRTGRARRRSGKRCSGLRHGGS